MCRLGELLGEYQAGGFVGYTSSKVSIGDDAPLGKLATEQQDKIA